ncbi:hypothetical protein DsansV1_C18g0151321 [Dioscorea sansibarensis]
MSNRSNDDGDDTDEFDKATLPTPEHTFLSSLRRRGGIAKQPCDTVAEVVAITLGDLWARLLPFRLDTDCGEEEATRLDCLDRDLDGETANISCRFEVEGGSCRLDVEGGGEKANRSYRFDAEGGSCRLDTEGCGEKANRSCHFDTEGGGEKANRLRRLDGDGDRERLRIIEPSERAEIREGGSLSFDSIGGVVIL